MFTAVLCCTVKSGAVQCTFRQLQSVRNHSFFNCVCTSSYFTIWWHTPRFLILPMQISCVGVLTALFETQTQSVLTVCSALCRPLASMLAGGLEDQLIGCVLNWILNCHLDAVIRSDLTCYSISFPSSSFFLYNHNHSIHCVFHISLSYDWPLYMQSNQAKTCRTVKSSPPLVSSVCQLL